MPFGQLRRRDWRRSIPRGAVVSKETNMPSTRSCPLVERSLELLIEARIELQSRSEISLLPQLDDIIALLQRAKYSTPPDHQLLTEALKVLGAGLAAFPAIMRLIHSLSKN
jgi:hypothetical protein